ncbi:MAG: TIGR03067 domain-containing protein [Isosphaeraceae bacterium]
MSLRWNRPFAATLAAILAWNSPSLAQDADQGEAAERAKLRGVWKLVFAESEGKIAPPERIKDVRVEIKDRTHSVFFGDTEIAHDIAFAIDPKASPKRTDDTINDGPDRGKHILGIYRLEDDTLVSCVGKPGGERPKAFSAASGSGQTLRVFLRVRPGEGPEAKAVREEFMRFSGTWRFDEMIAAGRKTPTDELGKYKLIVQGNQFTSVVGPLSMGGHFVVDPAARPKTIDIFFSDGSSVRGIYELSDDTYRVAFMLPGKERPKAFESKPGTSQVVEVLKRAPAGTK